MFEKIFQVQMYQGTGELQKKFQSSKSSTQVTNQSMFKFNHQYRCDDPMSNVNHFQLKSSSSVMTLLFKCQSLTIKVKYKCDDLVNQVSITISDHHQC